MAAFLGIVIAVMAFFVPRTVVFAHEVYVLTKEQFAEGLKNQGLRALTALESPENLLIFIKISLAILLLLILNFFFQRSRIGKKLDRRLERLVRFGPLLVRLAIAFSFLFSALDGKFLGPELSLGMMPFSSILRVALFVASFFLAFGIWTELAALLAFLVFTIGAYTFHWYLLTYLNYLGEILVLFLFGSRNWSLDYYLFGPLKRFKKLRNYETMILRVFYGVGIAYAAISVKFLHPILTVTVVKLYNLTRFHWLFPSDPLLVTLGAALVEFLIGVFLILGFEVRLTVFVSLVYLTLSLMYFREAMWPHLILYGISLNLLVSPEQFTLDRFFTRSGFLGKKAERRIKKAA